MGSVLFEQPNLTLKNIVGIINTIHIQNLRFSSPRLVTVMKLLIDIHKKVFVFPPCLLQYFSNREYDLLFFGNTSIHQTFSYGSFSLFIAAKFALAASIIHCGLKFLELNSMICLWEQVPACHLVPVIWLIST